MEGHGRILLYSYFRSSSSWRVRIALAIKGVPYEYKPVNLLKKEQRTPEYLMVNPMGLVPALSMNGKTITQSMAIMEYLDEIFPLSPLLPNDAYGKAKVRSYCDIINSGIQPMQNLQTLMKHSPNDEKERYDWARYWIQRGLMALEEEVIKTAGKYCYGDELTMADCCLAPQMASAERFGVDLGDIPTLTRIYRDLEQLEEFKDAHANNQPDTPR